MWAHVHLFVITSLFHWLVIGTNQHEQIFLLKKECLAYCFTPRKRKPWSRNKLTMQLAYNCHRIPNWTDEKMIESEAVWARIETNQQEHSTRSFFSSDLKWIHSRRIYHSGMKMNEIAFSWKHFLCDVLLPIYIPASLSQQLRSTWSLIMSCYYFVEHVGYESRENQTTTSNTPLTSCWLVWRLPIWCLGLLYSLFT